jgi:hypothetical protein
MLLSNLCGIFLLLYCIPVELSDWSLFQFFVLVNNSFIDTCVVGSCNDVPIKYVFDSGYSSDHMQSWL